MIHELRIYQIFEHNREAFHARFRDHAARLMRAHGFRILAMWECVAADGPEFVYLLAWPDEAARDAAWQRFMADPEWIETKRVTAEAHGDLVGAIAGRILRSVDYAPELGPAV